MRTAIFPTHWMSGMLSTETFNGPFPLDQLVAYLGDSYITTVEIERELEKVPDRYRQFVEHIQPTGRESITLKIDLVRVKPLEPRPSIFRSPA